MGLLTIRQRIKAYARAEIRVDASNLDKAQKGVVSELIEAGKMADQIFWKQSAPDALAIRDRFKDQRGPTQSFIEINYGPYDRLNGFVRFIGNGPPMKPMGAGFYPADLSRKAFLTYIADHPGERFSLEDQYTAVIRDNDRLVAIPYHQYYATEVQRLATHLLRASTMTPNSSLRRYLSQRARAIQTDRYFDSDMAWLDLKNNLIDVVIGPIENYEDRLFHNKAAYEAAVMIKDVTATGELEVYQQHLNRLEQNLPIDQKYKRTDVGSNNPLEIVNVLYFGGDFQAGVKTIAASLPNDEKVINLKGAKKQLYKNIMEAKYDQILLPIAGETLRPADSALLSKTCFVSQVLLHEISHTLGPNMIIGQATTLRKALQDQYAVIEECKADILGVYALDYFEDVFSLTADQLRQHYLTYLAGLFRSIRFGTEEAHGMANLIQLNFLIAEDAILHDASDNHYTINPEIFHTAVKKLAYEVLMIEIEGDRGNAEQFIQDWGQNSSMIRETIDQLREIPRDLDLSFRVDY